MKKMMISDLKSKPNSNPIQTQFFAQKRTPTQSAQIPSACPTAPILTVTFRALRTLFACKERKHFDI